MAHTLFMRGKGKRAKHFLPSGAVCGNGDVCLSACGESGTLTFHIGKSDFWKALPGNVSDGGIKTVGTLEVSGVCVRAMRTAQRIDEGLVTARCGAVRWELFVAPQNIAVFRVQSPAAKPAVTLRLTAAQGGGSEIKTERSARESVIERRFFGEELRFPSAVCAVLRELDPQTDDGTRIQTFVLSVVSNHNAADYRAAALSLAQEADVDALRQAHDAWWRDFWEKSSVTLSDRLLEEQWYADQYILACCCGHPAFPPGLFGNFIKSDDVPWHGDYHLNYNYQAPFYGVFAANRPFLADGYEAPLLDFMPEGERNAREFLGCRGIYYPVGIGPKGLNTSRAPSLEHDELFLGQKSDAAYGAVVMILRWNATRDTDYAARVYPYLRAAAQFFEDYAVFEDGRYQIKNDAIHEMPVYWQGFTYGCEDDYSTDTNNLLTLGLVRMLLPAAAEMADALGVDADSARTWRSLAGQLSPFPTFAYKGREVFRYTERGRAWNRGNTLCIQHIFPAGQIHLGSDAHLLEVARNTFSVEDRALDDNGANSYLPAGARIGMDEQTLTRALLRHLRKYRLPNGLFDHAGGGIEHNTMTMTTVNEMLLQSVGGTIRLFPVWRSDASFRTLRADGAFLVSAAQTGGEIGDVRVFSEKGGLLQMENPFPAATVTRGDGASQEVRGRICVQTQPGETLTIKKKA